MPLRPGIDDREGAATFEAVRGEERRADPAREERVAVRQAVNLLERVHREGAGALEPELVARARERLKKAVAVAGSAVAEAGALLLVVERACVPDELGALEQQLLVQVPACVDDDSRRAVAPLEARLVVPPLGRRPVRATVLDDCGAGEHVVRA